MNEGAKRRWDARMALVAPLLTMVGIIVGVWQFNEGADNRRSETAETEQLRDTIAFRRRLWQEKLTTYQKVTELAGRIIAATADDRVKAYKEFQTAYWGAMVLVEDPAVERAMIEFDREYRDQASGWSKDPDRLKVRADALAKACRASLETGRLESDPAKKATNP